MKTFALFILIFIYSCSDKTTINNGNTNDNYENAWKYLEEKDNLNAFVEFGKAKDVFLKQKDNLGVGKCLMNMGIISTDNGDYFGGQEIALEAKNFFDEKNKQDHYYINTNYNNLGIASYKLKDYNNAIKFYNLAIKFSDNLKDKNSYINNKALVLRDMKDYANAILLYQNLKNEKQNPQDESITINDNLAFTKWLQNPNYNPIPEFNKTLNIRLKEKDLWGLNSSYSHLADYYIKNEKDSALVYARKMLSIAKQIKSPDDQTEALQKLIYLEANNYSKDYFKLYQNINDSLQITRSKAKNQFALIRYETEKNKADFLKAQAESSERQNHIITQYFLIGIGAIISFFGYLWFTKRQKVLRQEKLLEVKNTELKYSKKVHDKVANRIYQILSQVENKDKIDKDSLLFGLENVYEISRDISYDNADINENQNFSDQLHQMLDSYTSDFTIVSFIGNKENVWEGISFQNKTEIYLILQELMTNMKKHSKADKVFLKFSKENKTVNISYTDNGIGMKNNLPKNGLQNMENRINAINGKINFDTETNLLKINISFPT